MPYSVRTAGHALRSRASTSVDLVEASLAAVALEQPLTNAFTQVDERGAREAAMIADRELARGLDRGPLHGIPVSVKDLIDEAGVVTTAASRVLAGRVADHDAVVRDRLRQAGAIVIGRTNLHEFALGTTSEDSAFGPVRNPHDQSRSAGGSSGGSAAAVARGMGLASIGTDTGGSIRIPAAACGIVGLKPSLGEVPTQGVVPLSRTLDHVGPMTRTVEDAVILFEVLAGVIAQKREYQPRELRLCQLRGYFEQPLDPAVRDAYRRALASLARAGVAMTSVSIGGTEMIAESYVNIVLPEAAHWHGALLDERASDYTPNVHRRMLQGRSIPATSYFDAREACLTLRSAVDAALNSGDALVLPTLPIVAPPLRSEDIDVGGVTMPVRTAMLKHTQLFNLTGHPAISIPIAVEGLPVGLQLVGRLGGTADLCAIARVCERILAEDAR